MIPTMVVRNRSSSGTVSWNSSRNRSWPRPLVDRPEHPGDLRNGPDAGRLEPSLLATVRRSATSGALAASWTSFSQGCGET